MANLKTPPHNDEAESSLLGAILIDKDAVGMVSEIVSPKDFYSDLNGIIYDAMLTLYEEGKPIDFVTLNKQLKKTKNGEKVESSYIGDLINSVPTAANIEHYAQIIKEESTKRSLISAGTQIVENAFIEDKEINELLDKAESSIFSISQGHSVKGFTQIKESLVESFDRIDELHKKGAGLRGITTGFTDLDNLLSGMQPSNLLILAARPGQGKTAMIINMSQNIAVEQKQPVGIFSLEMSQEELVDRLLIGQADIDAWRLKTGRLTENDLTNKIPKAMGELAEAPIFIDDTPGISVTEMRTKARRLQLEHGIKLLIIDYLQLADPGRRYDNRVQEVSIISQGLKNLARELKIPIIAVSQLSRAVEHRGEKRPQLADLRESGAIEQDADVVMFLYRTDDTATGIIPTKLLIAKHRNGPTGEVDLLFKGDRIKFYNVDKKREGE